MLTGTRAVTLALFALLGLSFLAGTGTLIWEFWDSGWFTIATHDSHLFLFFPTLGLVALAAFYVPALAFTDMYWQHVAYGRPRFIIGFLLLAGVSWAIASSLNSSPYRPIWDITPRVLQADKNQPAGCGEAPAKPCERVALLQSLESVRQVSSTHFGLKDFIRQCGTDPLIEASSTVEPRRFCFASTPLTSKPVLSTTDECCRAQTKLKDTILALSGPADQRSYTGRVHGLLLPLKVFFLLLLAAIGILLALRYKAVAHYYPNHINRIDLGVVVGAISVLMFPLMSQGFVQTADALYGTAQNAGFKPIVNAMTAAFAAWALLLLLVFYRRYDRDLEIVGKMAGVLASAFAVLKYDLLVSVITRLLGSGAGFPTIAVLLIASVGAAFLLVSPRAAAFFGGGAVILAAAAHETANAASKLPGTE
jgi:hypothetical protein